MRRPAVTLVLVSMLSVTACGGGEEAASGDRASTVEAPASAEPSSEVSEAEGKTLTEEQLKTALLDVQDLPTGWTAGETSEDEESTTSGTSQECSDKFKALSDADDKDVSAKAEASFEGPSLGSVLEHGLESYEDEDVPKQRFEDVLAVLNDCPTFTDVDDSGEKSNFTVSPLSFPKKGDETVALNIKVETPAVNAVLNLVVVRLGRNVMSMGQGGLTADIAVLEQAVDKGLSKLAAVAN